MPLSNSWGRMACAYSEGGGGGGATILRFFFVPATAGTGSDMGSEGGGGGGASRFPFFFTGGGFVFESLIESEAIAFPMVFSKVASFSISRAMARHS